MVSIIGHETGEKGSREGFESRPSVDKNLSLPRIEVPTRMVSP